MNHTRLYFIRHGQVIGHETPRYNGHTDVGLTPLGKRQLEAAAEDLKNVQFDAIYASDLIRARYGGDALARDRELELRLDPEFREINFGAWEGLSFEEIENRYPGEIRHRLEDFTHHRIPGGETIQEVWERVTSAVTRLISEHRNQTIGLVAHSGVNRCILIHSLGCGPELIWRVDQEYGCLNIVDYFEDGRNLVRLANGPNRATRELQGM